MTDPLEASQPADQTTAALVTGASRGIGFAIAERLRIDGMRLALTGRDPDSLAAAVKGLGGEPAAIGVAGSSDDPEHRGETVRAVLRAFGGLDVVVLNVGINLAYGPVLDLDLRRARKVVEVNLIGTIGWLQAVSQHVDRLPRSVVIVSSVAGLRPARNIGLYGATKAALVYLTTQLAAELAPDVRVNAVAPAVVRTRFAEPLYQDESVTVAEYPLRRLGDPEDVAAAVAFLAGEGASWITGQTLVVDGGLLLRGGV